MIIIQKGIFMKTFLCKLLRAASIFLIGVLLLPASVFMFLIRGLWKIVDYTFDKGGTL